MQMRESFKAFRMTAKDEVYGLWSAAACTSRKTRRRLPPKSLYMSSAV